VSLDTSALDAWYPRYRFDVRPVRDDAPYFWHFARFRDVIRGSSPLMVLNPEVGLGERLVLVLLALTVVLGAGLLVAPMLVRRRTWAGVPRKGWAAAYFGALGVGFMLLEISLIQQLTLFLGYPTHSLTVTLFALLVSTGLGSLASGRYRRPAAALLALSGVLVVLVAAYRLLATPLLVQAFGWPFAGRVALCVAIVAPLGFCLGGFMPLGLRTVRATSQFVAWAWATNAFASVVGSVLTTVLSMVIGFRAVMLTALVVYLIGVAALRVGFGRGR
jgi:hypothetical protein